MNHVSRIRSAKMFTASVFAIVLAFAFADLAAQAPPAPPSPVPVPYRNVSMTSGPMDVTFPPLQIVGNPWRAQSNEGSSAPSTRNSLVIFGGGNDYRLVDLPGVDSSKMITDAWGGVYQSKDGGTTWQSTIHPGHPLDSKPSFLKNYQAIADVSVKQAAAGVFYYTAIALNRDPNGQGSVFTSTWIHLNDEEGDPMPTKWVWEKEIDKGNAGRFIDKPWSFVGEPLPGATCVMDVVVPVPANAGLNATGSRTVHQVVPASPLYVVWSAFTGATDFRSKVMFAKSTDCGKTFSNPIKLSESQQVVQGAQVAASRDPITGQDRVVVVWRRGQTANAADGLGGVVSTNGGDTFTKPATVADFCPFDQGSSPYSFRHTAYSALTVDRFGRFYIAYAARTATAGIPDSCANGQARVLLQSSMDGLAWSAASQVEPNPQFGHQVFPAITINGDRLEIVWMDFRDDAAAPFRGFPFIEEQSILNAIAQGAPGMKRHTADIRGAQASVNAAGPGPFAYHKVSQYITGLVNGHLEQLQWNPVNVRMFKKMSIVFHSDYLDVSGVDLMPKDPFASPGQWTRGYAWGAQPNYVSFTDNRLVKLFSGEDYSKPRPYTPPTLTQALANNNTSTGDPSVARPVCDANYTGTKNQSLFAARLLQGGLFAGSAGNNKPTGAIQRAFVVFVQNVNGPTPADTGTRFVNLTIQAQPGVVASFNQFDPTIKTLTNVEIRSRSTLARTVYVSSPGVVRAPVLVQVTQVGGPFRQTILLNADPTAPPSLDRPDSVPQLDPNYDIAQFEVHDVSLTSLNPIDLTAPHTSSSGWTTPDWQNPDWQNPDWQNPDWQNPDWQNPDWQNPDWQNPDWQNPDWQNPDWQNGAFPDGAPNGSIREARFKQKNTGNTTSAVNTSVAVNGSLGTASLQLVGYKLTATPAMDGCGRGLVASTQVMFNLTDPADFVNVPPSASKAMASLDPGETLFLSVRIWDPVNLTPVVEAGVIEVKAQPQAVNTKEATDGNPNNDVPPVTSSLSILTASLNDGVNGSAYSQTLSGTGGKTPYVWSSTPINPAPGLTINPSTGVISGTPTQTGTFTFVARLTDASAPAQATTRTLVIRVADPLVITTASPLAFGAVGQAYGPLALASTGGLGNKTWSIAGGALPGGLALTPSGVIAGSPTAPGTFNFTVGVTDSANPAQVATKPFAILVASVNGLIVNGDFETGDLSGWTMNQSNAELQQAVLAAPPEFVPPQSGMAYKIRPGNAAPDAGLKQTVSVTPGKPYAWSVDVGAREVQNPGNPNFPLGTFEVRLNGAVVATVTYGDALTHTAVFSGTFTPGTGVTTVTFELVFNRALSSFTAHPQWWIDNVWFEPVAFTGATTDPIGDVGTGETDLTSARLSATASHLHLEAHFDPATFNPATAITFVDIDIDQQIATGQPGVTAGGNDAAALGVEYIVLFGSSSQSSGGIPYATVYQYAGTPGSFTPTSSVPITVTSDGYDVFLPLSLLGNDDGKLNYKVLGGRQITTNPPTFTNYQTSDKMPEEGQAAVPLVAP